VRRIETTVMGLRHLGDDGTAFDAREQSHEPQATFVRDASTGVTPKLRHREE
jgi:hypothetical protein